MRFILNYSIKGIKSAKARALLIIFSVGLVSLLFFASIVLPLFINNAINDSIYQRAGNSDIVVSMHTTNAERNIESMIELETKCGTEFIDDNFEYAISTMTLAGSYENIKGKKMTIGIVGTNFDDAMKIGGIEFSSGSPTTLKSGEMIITETLANENNIKVNDYITLTINNRTCYFKVIGISANKGILNESSYPVVLINKTYIRTNIMSTYRDDIFNIALFKVRDGVDKQEMLDKLKEVYPDFNCSFVMSSTQQTQLKTTIFYVYYICAAIGVIFSVIVIFLTMNLIFARRTQEFSRLRSMGATNKQLIASCLFESGLYGCTGGLLSAVLGIALYLILQRIEFAYRIFYGMNYALLILPILFGILVSVGSGIIPAIKSIRKSVRSEMVKSNTIHKRTYIISGFVAALLIASLVVLLVFDIGDVPVLSLASFFGVLLSTMYLIPLVISLLVKLVIKCFRKKNFTMIYIDKNIYTPSTNMVTRILAFGLSFIMILSMAVTTVYECAYDFAYDTRLNAYISGKNSYTAEEIEYVKSLDGVEDAYETIVYAYLSVGTDNSSIYANYSFTPEVFERLYKDVLITPEETIEKFSSVKYGIVVNEARYYIDNMRIGDKILVRFNSNDSYIEEFEIIGFFDSMEKNYGSVIFNMNNMKELSGKFGGSYRLAMQVDKDKYNDVQDALYENLLVGEESVSSTHHKDDLDYSSITSPMILVRGYMGLVVILCTICIVVGMCLSIRETTKQSKILYQLGMSKRRFLFTMMAEISIITILSAAVGWFITVMLQQNMSKILIFAKAYIEGLINNGEMALLALGIMILNLGLSIYLTKYLFNKISQNAKINFNDD